MTQERQSTRSIDELNASAQNMLREILKKEPAAIVDEERGFLKGRRDYLTAEQRADYGVDEKPKTEAKLEDMKLADLQAKAAELGLPQEGTRAELIERIKAK